MKITAFMGCMAPKLPVVMLDCLYSAASFWDLDEGEKLGEDLICEFRSCTSKVSHVVLI